MRRLVLTLPTPAENVALDEALLDWGEAKDLDWECLRLWEPPRPMVVVGRSTRVDQEVHVDVCRERGIEIVRRSSGGASIVAGPGCLMYAVVLSYKRRPELKDIPRAHSFVLNRNAKQLTAALGGVGTVAHAGTSDLVFVATTLRAVPGESPAAAGSVEQSLRKFSGNSLRCRRTHLLYHGTLLYDFDLALVEKCLRLPPRQPDYRQRRAHAEFVTNLPIARESLTEAIDRAWPTQGEVENWPADRVAVLAAERFSRDEWNLSFP
jgi:lipoate---protein ligase